MVEGHGKEFEGMEYEVDERAGILQFDGWLHPVHALNKARVEIRNRMIEDGTYLTDVLSEA